MTLQDMLLQIVGPISPLSTQVVVQGCGSGSVQLFSGATPVSAPTAGDGVEARVQPFPGSLVPGVQIVAREHNGQAVGPTSPPQVVSPAPTADDMGLLTFLEVPTTCVDWVVLGGSYPGATVEVLHGGVPVGRETATGPTTSVRLTLPGRLTAGDTLEAVQYCEPAPGTALRSPHAFSAPAEKAPPFGTISVDQPVECDLELHLTALPRGASLVVDHNGDVLAGYPYVGPSPRARLRDNARIGDATLAALRKCKSLKELKIFRTDCRPAGDRGLLRVRVTRPRRGADARRVRRDLDRPHGPARARVEAAGVHRDPDAAAVPQAAPGRDPQGQADRLQRRCDVRAVHGDAGRGPAGRRRRAGDRRRRARVVDARAGPPARR